MPISRHGKSIAPFGNFLRTRLRKNNNYNYHFKNTNSIWLIVAFDLKLAFDIIQHSTSQESPLNGMLTLDKLLPMEGVGKGVTVRTITPPYA
jgi:hypothetical protein